MEFLLIAALSLTGVMVADGHCDNHVKGWQQENWIILCDDDPQVLRHESIHMIQHNLGQNILPEETLSPLVATLPEGDVLFVISHYHEDDIQAELEARVLQDLPSPIIAFGILTSHILGS